MNGIARFLVGIGLAAAAAVFFVLTSAVGLVLAAMIALAFLLNIGGIRSRFRAVKDGGAWVFAPFGREQGQDERMPGEDGRYAHEDGARRISEDSGPCVDLEASEYRRVRREEGDQSS